MVAYSLWCVTGAAAQSLTVHDDTLAPYRVVDGAIPAPLTSTPGDPVKGKAVALDRKLGNCLSCHNLPVPDADQGTLGPDLRGAGALSVGQLRLRVVNPKLLFPQTIMPAYYRIAGLHHVDTAFRYTTILTAQQVEDLVAYLHTLK